MHKGVKLLVLFFSLSFLFTCGHNISRSPLVMKVNDGDPLFVDVLDLWVYTDVDGSDVEAEAIPNVAVPIEITYNETGIGLPTNPPYTAQLTKYTVDFVDVTTTPPTVINMDKVTGYCNFVIESGGKEVTQNLLIVPHEWIEKYMGELEPGLVIRARIKLTGIELISQKEITSSEGYITLNMADYEDDPRKLGS